ncbi:MAG: hypothetical protein JWO67_6027 [Streptosporangiaceae bacterium]|nr:hypothetical protein [Streptosporangiaceae bacterium]
MQTFLPYADFTATAQVLDPRRLGKQRVETLQVLRGLTVTGYGWRHHPAVRSSRRPGRPAVRVAPLGPFRLGLLRPRMRSLIAISPSAAAPVIRPDLQG